MVIQTPGKVPERITLLGHKESNVYYLDGGTEAALLGGGMVYIAPDVIDQIRAILDKPQRNSGKSWKSPWRVPTIRARRPRKLRKR